MRRFSNNLRIGTIQLLNKNNFQSNEVDFAVQKRQKELVAEIVGVKEKQRVVLTSSLSKDRKYR